MPAKPFLETCISLVSRFSILTRLSLAEYSLYLGFVVLTPLQVLTVVMDIGPLSQTPHRSRLLCQLTSENHVEGQDVVSHHLSVSLSTMWNFIKNSVIVLLLICELVVKLKTL